MSEESKKLWRQTLIAAVVLIAVLIATVWIYLKLWPHDMGILGGALAIGMAFVPRGQKHIPDQVGSYQLPPDEKPGLSRNALILFGSLGLMALCGCLALGVFLTFPYWSRWIGG